MLNKKSLSSVDVHGKRVFVRVDFNVPLRGGDIADDARIAQTLPTIRHLVEQNACVILASHLGRPKGKPAREFSLEPVQRRLSELLSRPVRLTHDCVGEEVEAIARAMRAGDILLLENLRFHNEEEKNNSSFARSLAKLAEIYVNDAFGAAHRAHASTEGITKFLRPAVAGFLMAREIEVLSRLLEQPERPFVAVLGGAKVSDKIGVIENLLNRVDTLLIGGAMSHAFFEAKGWQVGKSLLDPTDVLVARALMQQPQAGKLRIPTDVMIADRDADEASVSIVPANDIHPEWMALDIGPATIAGYAELLRPARTVFWNGPLGRFETPRFAEGTRAIARAIAECNGMTVAGGGDSSAALKLFGLGDKITHISTGGGASLEFLEGRVLPGVAALDDA